MAGDLKLKAGTLVTAQDGTSGTLATATRIKAATSALDNTAALDPTWDFCLATGFSVAPTPGIGIVVGLYAVPYVDGTNAGAVDTATPKFPGGTFVGNFEVILAQTAVQYLVIQGVPLSALKYDLYVDNESGQTMSAGWTLKAQPTLSQYT